MNSTLIKNGFVLGSGYTDIAVVGNKITKIEQNLLADNGDQVIDAKGCVVYPGLINTHHHLTQSLAKAVPAGINLDLNHWLGAVPYALWPKFTPEIIYTGAVLGLYELIRSGCTTCADHFYIYHRDVSMEIEDALYQAAADVGIRFVHCRGGATHTGSHRGGSTSDFVPESLDLYLQRLQKTCATYHQSSDDAMRKLVVAPTSIVHTSPPEHLQAFSDFARTNGLRLHSHLLEVGYDEIMAQENYQLRAIDYAESTGWLGDNVWFAHLVHADDYAIKKMAQTGTGIAHCPTSNCRLGSGVAKVPEMARAGMKVSLGVDGSASSESASMMNELMLSWLLHRSQSGPAATTLPEVLSWGTKGGAEVLGFTNLGELKCGMLADLTVIDLDQPRFWGMWDQPYAPVACGEPITVKTSMINGNIVYQDQGLTGLDIHKLKADARQAVTALMKNT